MYIGPFENMPCRVTDQTEETPETGQTGYLGGAGCAQSYVVYGLHG